MTDVLTIEGFLRALGRHWKIALALTVLGAVAGVGVAKVLPKTYTAKATVMVMATSETKDSAYQDAQFAEKRAAVYPELIDSVTVIEGVQKQLSLTTSVSGLRKAISATHPIETPLVVISAEAGSANAARDLANAAADQLGAFVKTLESSKLTITNASPALAPRFPSFPLTNQLTLLGLLLGMGLGIVAALVLDGRRRLKRRKGVRADASQP